MFLLLVPQDGNTPLDCAMKYKRTETIALLQVLLPLFLLESECVGNDFLSFGYSRAAGRRAASASAPSLQRPRKLFHRLALFFSVRHEIFILAMRIMFDVGSFQQIAYLFSNSRSYSLVAFRILWATFFMRVLDFFNGNPIY